MRAVLQVLLLRVGVHRRHEAVLDAGEFVEHRRQRRERVGRARGVRDDRVHGRVVGVGVDAERERDVGAVGGRADEHLLRARVEVGAGGVAEVNRPVDSSTMSTSSSAHGRCAGSRSASTLMRRPSTTRVSPSTSPGGRAGRRCCRGEQLGERAGR